MKRKVNIAILGDSISEGIGSKKYNYCNLLKQNIEIETDVTCTVKNFAYTGTTIEYANEIFKDVLDFKPDIIISFYGNVDAMVRPKITGKPNYYSLIPKRFKKNGMLDPRPFYSSNKVRCFFEHIDSFIRYNLKKILLKLQGDYCWVNIESFIEEYELFLERVSSANCKIFMVSTVVVDEYYFPGTQKNYRKYNKCIEKIANDKGANYIDVYNPLSKYNWDDVFNKDHFHPNTNGYKILASILTDNILEVL
ncbi:MAG: hypothetical protein PWR19_1966 [Carnobacterium sp.]|uniref:SGNH/GDSL hydrolase family protein n=1 Tax=Carnobacterium sp. TaxID=48221 RepID=UPI002648D498|nr:SGNH/GDSL hydrolase family protein [Carnobacterium sp.]MDN5372920.1 hypothetical protein [Carnobacterium sp.]